LFSERDRYSESEHGLWTKLESKPVPS
jgi:hypothetical protein